MDFNKALLPAAVGTAAVYGVFVLFGMNVAGWMGVLMAEGAPNLVGVLVLAGLCLLCTLVWQAAVMGQGKMPPVVAGLLFGAVVGAAFVWLVPLGLFAIQKDPNIAHSTGTFWDVFPETFGGHRMVPPPMLDDAPLESSVDGDWIQRDGWKERLLPFMVAFAAFGLTLGLMAPKKGE
jgi:hypothetical protein